MSKYKFPFKNADRKMIVLVVFVIMSSSTVLARNKRQDHPHQRRFFDLTHAYDETMPIKSEDVKAPFEPNTAFQDEGYGARSEYFDFCTTEKLGTHINAPRTYHQYNNSLTVDKIPLKFLINVPGVVVDLPASEEGNDRAAMLNRNHLEEWEQNHGKIPHGGFVILRTGWSSFYKYPDRFFGNFDDFEKPLFPGFSPDAVNWLLESRDIAGIGTECADVELPWKTNQAVKNTLAGANKYSVVQLAHVDLLPFTGFVVTIAPIKMTGGSGGPTRVFAALHSHNSHSGHASHHNNYNHRHINNLIDDDLDHGDVIDGDTSSKVRRVEPREEPSSVSSNEVEPPTTFSSNRPNHHAAGYHNRAPQMTSSRISSFLFCLSVTFVSSLVLLLV